MQVLNTLLFWTALCLLAWNAYMLLFNRGVPNIRTAPAIRRKIIELIGADIAASAGRPYIVMDLGAGNGLLTRAIARSLPGAQVVGFEISWPAYLWARTCQRLLGIRNLEYRRSDFYACDLSAADAVVMFLNIYDMERIGKKLHQELKKGALATSNRFRLGNGWEPAEMHEVKTLYPFQKSLFVYRKV